MQNNSTDREPRKISYLSLGLSLGVASGLIFSAAVSNPAFYPLGIGIGLCLGQVLDHNRTKRRP